jgi:hypothetical protein
VDAVSNERWADARSTLGQMEAARAAEWSNSAPPLLAEQLDEELGDLSEAIQSARARRAATAAIGVARTALDLRLRHEAPEVIDLGRFELLARQLVVDAGARDRAAVGSDAAALEWTRDRIGDASDPAVAALDDELRFLEATAVAAEFGKVRQSARRLIAIAAGMQGSA